MHIKSITLNNYRPFLGETTFNFNHDEEINFNVIFGKNGSGKSILINALYWCLYGVELLNEGIQPICNYDALNECAVDDKIKVSVSCQFSNDNKIYLVERDIYFIKINDLNEFQRGHSHIECFINDGPVASENTLISHNFPRNLFPLLLFDTEYLEYFLQNNFFHSLNDIFYKFVGNDILDKVNLHLDKLSNYYNKEVKLLNHDEEYRKLCFQQEKIENNLNETKFKINKISTEIIHLEDKYYQIKKELAQLDFEVNGKNLKDMNVEREILFNRISDLKNRRESCLKEKDKFLFQSFPILVGLSTIDGKLNNEKLENMLLKNADFKNSRFYEGYFNIPNLFDKYGSNVYLKHHLSEIKSIDDKLYEYDERLMEIESFILNIDNSYIKKRNSELDKIEKTIKKLKYNLESLKSIKKSLTKSFEYNLKRIKHHKEVEKNNSLEINRHEFCSEVKNFGKLVKTELNNQLHVKFLKIINSFFINDFKMGDKFNKIIIENLQEMYIIKNNHQKISINDLSRVERKLFNLSLIFATHECLQLNYPIILMDPFVNLDGEKRNVIVSFILDNLKKHQFLIILNENQYDDSLKLSFLRNDVKEFSLVNIDGNVKVE